MKPVWMYLDEAAERGIAKNDSDIARKLDVSRAAVSRWRKELDAPAEDTAARLADLLGKPEIMAECAAARAKTPEGRRMWERLAKIAAAAMIMLASFSSADTTAGFEGQYAPRIPILPVFRSNGVSK
ncbi:helix-turn-helix domain-containing protein [Methyloversatilis universalis]|uniref:helix-turn-helix domain-containing protein n=1 Tax=Methyloversatilis universalis TaxID=378211 RepID=UPI0018DED445|nr:helix-turn-helix transcriptional regulator [Methyloversatilis universalis]